MSLTTILIALIGIGYFGKEIIQKQNPYVIPTVKKYDDFATLAISSSGFFFNFGVEDVNYNYYIDNRIYNVTAEHSGYHINNNNEQEWFYNTLTPSICSQLYSNLSDALPGIEVNLDAMWCLPDNVSQIRGFYGSKNYEYVAITVSKCVNSTENNNLCLSTEEINQNIQ